MEDGEESTALPLLERPSLAEDFEEDQENPPAQCSSCSATIFGSYLYGLVFPDHDLFAQMGRGEIRLGGCCIEFDSPQWFCRTCNTDHL
jgi:hypothetical protein|tara:strand:- start:148 stop:414 length:267 start_codon:yes stop_codon:yes gene_type:complete